MAALELSRRRAPELRRATHESATAELIARSYAERGRAMLYGLCALFATIIVFISFVQLDRLVKTQGRLMPIEGAFTVQPLDKQIIRRILVAVGDRVKKGQVLATCDPTFAAADLLALQQKVDSLDAELRRVKAEIDEKPFLPTAKDVYDPVQAALWQRRQTEYSSGVADFDQRIKVAAALISQLRQDIPTTEGQLKIAEKVESMNTELQKPGYVSQIDLLTSQNTRLQTARNLADSQSQLESALHQRDSLSEQRKVFIDKWHEDELKEQVDTQTAFDQSNQDLIKAQRNSELVNLTAPEDAIVIKIPKLTAGAVAIDAQPLFGLVPIDAPLEADVQIDSQDIGFVQVGDKVTMKMDAYRYLEHGYVYGVVKTIGVDTLTDASSDDTGGGSSSADQTRSPFYDARVTIKDIKLHDVPADAHLIPGMTLQADIVVGRRTILWYLFGGALRSGAEAMHEP